MVNKFNTNLANLLRATAIGAVILTTNSVAVLADAGHGKKIDIGQAGKVDNVMQTITIIVDDNYYEPESITVLPGSTVKFIIVNKGDALHEFNIGTPSMHAKHQEEMAMMVEHGMLTETGMKDMGNMDMEGMDSGMMAHDDPNSILVAPGETQEILWQFTQIENLEYGCNIPGHYESGMVGEFIFDGPSS